MAAAGRAVDDGGATTTAVGVTGAQTISFDAAGGCGKALGDEASWGGMFTSPDSAWLLDITVEDTFDAGTYPTADHVSGQATVFLTDGAGTTYDAMPGAGSSSLMRARAAARSSRR